MKEHIQYKWFFFIRSIDIWKIRIWKTSQKQEFVLLAFGERKERTTLVGHFGIWMMMQCRWWQTFLVVLVVYSAWVSPFELAFKKVATGSLLPVDLVVDAFFALDIVLTFFVAYLDKSTYLLVDDHKKIAVRYVHFTHSK